MGNNRKRGKTGVERRHRLSAAVMEEIIIVDTKSATLSDMKVSVLLGSINRNPEARTRG